ncbi:MAG: S9 family peptidase [Caldilineaceae bacterium]|nr:S9 family peptidase [Caldilineaceae bacterium]
MESTNDFRIESLLAARQFLNPQLVGNRIYFISDLSGRLSLYAMSEEGSVPEPLLPPHIALQNPHLLGGRAFVVLPKLDKIMVMIDSDGDENYQPMLIPQLGGIPQPLFGDEFAGQQLVCAKCDAEHLQAIFVVDPRQEANYSAFMVNLQTLAKTDLGSSPYGNYPLAVTEAYDQVVLAESYTSGDVVLFRWQAGQSSRTLFYGEPLAQRADSDTPMLNGIGGGAFTPRGNLLLTTSLFDDQYGLGYLNVASPVVQEVNIQGLQHAGIGELENVTHLDGNRYLLQYNIDGCSWVYVGEFDEEARQFIIAKTLCGQGELRDGVLESIAHDKESDRFVLSFSTATTPAQIYLLDENGPSPRTNERVLGIPAELLAAGEDASYTSHDGLRISARLYLPAAELGFAGPRPLVFYIHGGPQSQERPDFTWFSMPLIQFLTLNGMAVFVPNVRGSSGYGLAYMKHVDRDWGGQDRLDHVWALELLAADPRLDTTRAAVVGRSYGGYMTLTLAGRHPELWRAACDMFGPYNLFTFMERLPPTWRTYFEIALGHPERDHDFLVERSPDTHLHQLACPMLVIQGANDPRVVEKESSDLVDALRAQGKEIDYLVFANEGHDVIKYENKVRCYNAITTFFAQHLKP